MNIEYELEYILMLHTPGLCNELYLHESHIGCNTLLARRLFLKQNDKFQGEKKWNFYTNDMVKIIKFLNFYVGEFLPSSANYASPGTFPCSISRIYIMLNEISSLSSKGT